MCIVIYAQRWRKMIIGDTWSPFAKVYEIEHNKFSILMCKPDKQVQSRRKKTQS